MKILAIDPMRNHVQFCLLEDGVELMNGVTQVSIQKLVSSVKVNPENVVIDSCYKTAEIYKLCGKYGYTPSKSYAKKPTNQLRNGLFYYKGSMSIDDDDALHLARKFAEYKNNP